MHGGVGVTGDSNGLRDVFVKDFGTGLTRLVSRGNAGALGPVPANGSSSEPRLSTNGRYVVFNSRATNLVLMGDQMQLPQPAQGSHPADSGQSILDYLLGESPTVANERGIFLDTTYRMHPAINAFISDAVYDGGNVPRMDRQRRDAPRRHRP